jgi:tetratricopeptide (TPR) repeat protein
MLMLACKTNTMWRKIFTGLFFLSPVIAMSQVTDSVANNRGQQFLAAVAAPAGTTYAIVVGISKYKEVTSLRFADRDAGVFYRYLLSKTGMALDSNNVKFFTNEAANLNNIGNAISDILQKIKKDDKVIFFFAGHGDYDAKVRTTEALLLLYGSPKANYFQNIFGADFISTAQLNDLFVGPMSAKGVEVMLIIDACHATGVDKALSGGAEGGRITAMALQNMPSPVKLYSCQANQTSLEGEQWGGGRGLFSYVMMEGLYGMADADSDKVVSYRELQRYLEDRVPVLAKPNKQDPVIKLEDATKTAGKVNDSLLLAYRIQKDKDMVFLSTASTKGSQEFIFREMDSTTKKIYDECNDLLEKKELDSAYQRFLLLNKIADTTNEAIIQLRRNLSAAYQEKAAIILRPMQEDVYNFRCSIADLVVTEAEMTKAAELLGENHFLYKNLQGRILFLKALEIRIAKDTVKFTDAAGLLEQSVLLDPNAPYAYYYLGYFYRNNNKEKARINYQKYLDLMPNSCWANNNLGFVYLGLKNYEEAIKSIKRAIELKPDYVNAWNNLANVYYNQENYTEAIKYYRGAVAIKPDYQTAWTNMATSYMVLGFYDSAADCSKKIIELRPELAESYYNVARAYSMQNKIPDALQYFDKGMQVGKMTLAQLQGETELANLRAKPAFKDLLKKYYSKDEIKKYPGLFVDRH